MHNTATTITSASAKTRQRTAIQALCDRVCGAPVKGLEVSVISPARRARLTRIARLEDLAYRRML